MLCDNPTTRAYYTRCRMPAIFSKNCILKGDVDSYCLVCSTRLCEEEDVLAHIQNLNHKTSLKPIAYYEKFKDDFIRKVKGIYFCELCNKAYTTSVKLGIHLAEEIHVNRRRTLLRRVGTSIIFQKNTVIQERSWNGLVEDTCVVCNVDFDDYWTHLSEQTHIFNVIRGKLIIDSNNNIYRKVEGGYQCLTCNTLVSDNCITEHLKSTDHISAIVKDDSSPCTGSDEIKAKGSVENKNKQEAERHVVVKDPETKPSKKNTIDGQSSSSGPSQIKDKQISSKSINKEVETFVKQHGLSINEFNNTVHCAVCTLQVPATITCVKEHVFGKKHKEKYLKLTFASQLNKNNIKTVKINDFITRVEEVVSLRGSFLIINQQFYLKFEEFFGLAMFANKLVCGFCHIDLNPDNGSAHLKSTLHRSIMVNSLVVTSLEREFVRQVKSDLYHCGYCGTVESDFDDMLDHLNTTRHKMRRAEREVTLQRIECEESTGFPRFYSLLANF